MSALNFEFLVQPTRMEGKNSYCFVKCVITCVINEQCNRCEFPLLSQNTLLDNGNFKITNKGYAANLTSFWLGGPTHLHEMEATKRQTLCRNLFKDSRTVTGEFAFWSRVEGQG